MQTMSSLLSQRSSVHSAASIHPRCTRSWVAGRTGPHLTLATTSWFDREMWNHYWGELSLGWRVNVSQNCPEVKMLELRDKDQWAWWPGWDPWCKGPQHLFCVMSQNRHHGLHRQKPGSQESFPWRHNPLPGHIHFQPRLDLDLPRELLSFASWHLLDKRLSPQIDGVPLKAGARCFCCCCSPWQLPLPYTLPDTNHWTAEWRLQNKAEVLSLGGQLYSRFGKSKY